MIRVLSHSVAPGAGGGGGGGSALSSCPFFSLSSVSFFSCVELLALVINACISFGKRLWDASVFEKATIDHSCSVIVRRFR